MMAFGEMEAARSWAVWVDDRAVNSSLDESGRGNTDAGVLLHGLG